MLNPIPLKREIRRVCPKCPEEGSSMVRDYLNAGRLGFVLLAGGAGSRLGHFLPKGTFPVGPVTGKSLFQIHLEKLSRLQETCSAPLFLFLMTSRVTHSDTLTFLQDHAFFGFPESQVFLFEQNEVPVISLRDGQPYRDSSGRKIFAPDGHGGLITALGTSGMYDRMEKLGIDTIETFHVDNPLVPLADPVMLEEHLQNHSDMTLLAVEKESPLEKVGNIVHPHNDRASLHVVEYMDFPDSLAIQRNASGKLTFWAGSIGIHLIERAFLQRMQRNLAANEHFLPLHLPRKKVATDDGEVEVLKPERFIFDILPFAERPQVVVADRLEVFATLKDDPDVVRSHLSRLYASWLKEAGITFPEKAVVEISPRLAVCWEELKKHFPDPFRMEENRIYLDLS
ncbi:MAG: UTP--glucose-1-phosphate uridylyltransferase [Planctomycetia bacterium]|nr:UTP--glucose-1-phosphate uridylyltransferase [Planctomycetia bacterium]